LQHGKSLFISSLIYEIRISLNSKNFFFIGSRRDEKIMQTTLKMNPISFFYFESNNTTCLFNLLDTPGHSNLSSEIESGFRISDGIVLLIDCIEGVNILTKKLLNKIIFFKKICFIIYSKLDKVIFELKIPPEETMKKLNYITSKINQINLFLGYDMLLHYNPTKNNIGFLSSKYHTFFTIKSFISLYSVKNIDNYNNKKLYSFFWNKSYFIPGERLILSNNNDNNNSGIYSSVVFILSPFYKIINFCLTEHPKQIYKF